MCCTVHGEPVCAVHGEPVCAVHGEPVCVVLTLVSSQTTPPCGEWSGHETMLYCAW